MVTEQEKRRALILEGWKDIGKLFGMAGLLDLIFQYIAFRWIYPRETVAVAFILAVIPYIATRGITQRIARRFVQ